MQKVIDVPGSFADQQLLRLPQVLALVGISRSSLYALIQRGAWPAPSKIAGGRASAWRAGDVRAALAAIASQPE